MSNQCSKMSMFRPLCKVPAYSNFSVARLINFERPIDPMHKHPASEKANRA